MTQVLQSLKFLNVGLDVLSYGDGSPTIFLLFVVLLDVLFFQLVDYLLIHLLKVRRYLLLLRLLIYSLVFKFWHLKTLVTIEVIYKWVEHFIQLILLSQNLLQDLLRSLELTLNLAYLWLETKHGLTQTFKLVLLGVICSWLVLPP